MGESAGDTSGGEAFNTGVVEHLLQVFKKNHVEAVFSTGDLVSGATKNKGGDVWILSQQLQDFLQLYSSILGNIPFYPVMGANELIASKSSSEFRGAFNIETRHNFDANTFGYTVSIEDAFFVVIPTDLYDAMHHVAQPYFSPDLIQWLDKVLKGGAETHSYLFVLGHEPAFPSDEITFENELTEKDSFWKVLVQNRVLAYFASHERLFDRSNHHGVWQIISGGGGANLREDRGVKSFYHCLVLSVPVDHILAPSLDVLDEQGKVLDHFELTSSATPLHQLHISSISPKKN